MPHLHHLSTVSIATGLLAVSAAAFGLLPGVWLVAGIGLVLAGISKAIILAIWNGAIA